jgi:nicotinamide-nucleotide amidase
MSARAGILITCTEVLTGRVADQNGPWLADRLL